MGVFNVGIWRTMTCVLIAATHNIIAFLLQISHVTIMLLSYHSVLSFYMITCFGVNFSSATNSTICQAHIHLLQQYVRSELPINALLDANVTILPGHVFTSFSGITVRAHKAPSNCAFTVWVPFRKQFVHCNSRGLKYTLVVICFRFLANEYNSRAVVSCGKFVVITYLKMMAELRRAKLNYDWKLVSGMGTMVYMFSVTPWISNYISWKVWDAIGKI